jgi:hypothetical protein
MKIMKQGPMEQHRRRKCRLRNHNILEVEQLKRRRYGQRNHRTLGEGLGRK